MARITLLSFAFVAACSLEIVQGGQATVVSYQTTDLVDQQTQSGHMYFGDNQLKIVTAAGPGTPASEMIYRADRELVWIVDHQQKRFVQMDRKTMQKMADRFAGIRKQMESQVAKLPPDERAQAERMLKAQPSEPRQQVSGELKRAGQTRLINGYSCTRYEFYLNEQLDSILWVTRDSELNFSAMAKLLRSMGEFYSALTRNLPGGSQSVDFDFGAFSELDGFPILIHNMAGGEAISETQIRRIRQENVKDGFFDIPAGYQPANPQND